MLVPVFTLKMNHRVNPQMVALGYYDGKHPCLTCATTAGKVFIHDPHSRSSRDPVGGRLTGQSDRDISLLNINQAVSAVCTARMPGEARDFLVVGSHTNLLVYDVERNADLFYKDTQDGSNAIAVGKLGSIATPMIIIGGNCSIQGYDFSGNDLFWTVTGDNVCSLALVDFNNSGENELLVGSEDFDIRVFHEDEIITEITETEAVTSLCHITGTRFGYALANGTVGVYDRNVRSWRIKSKNQPVTISSFDLDADGVPELVTGWSNGKLDVRNDRTGDVIFKDNFPQAVAGLVQGDYRMDGTEILIACGVDGEVRGYQAAGSEMKGNLMDTNHDQDMIRELSLKKQHLLLELKNYEATSKETREEQQSGVVDAEMGIIPANTKLQTTLSINHGSETIPPHVQLLVCTTNDTIIKAVLIFAEGIFEGECHVIHPQMSALQSSVSAPLILPRDLPLDLHIKAFVGYKTSTQFHVYELARQLPRFSMYALVTEEFKVPPKGSVTFQINERINRVTMWVNQNFLLQDDLEAHSPLHVLFLSIRRPVPLVIDMDASGQVTLKTDSMDLAADVIQALCSFLKIEDLQTSVDFPEDLEELLLILNKVEEFHKARQKLSAEMADHSNLIRSLVVRAEDARLMGDMKNMRRGYMELYSLNRDLINGYKIRCNNHQELLARLKEVNKMIQRAGRLRVGKHKTNVIAGCREAIKTNNVSSLMKLIKTGMS